MKYAMVLVLLTGCSVFSGGLDKQATSANLANVEAITAQNEAYLVKDARADSLKTADRKRNTEALALAKKMDEVK